MLTISNIFDLNELDFETVCEIDNNDDMSDLELANTIFKQILTSLFSNDASTVRHSIINFHRFINQQYHHILTDLIEHDYLIFEYFNTINLVHKHIDPIEYDLIINNDDMIDILIY